MENLLLLGVCFLLGVGLRKTGIIDERGTAGLNAVIIHMSLPALALLHVHDLHISPGLVLPAAMPWIVFGVGWLFFNFWGRRLGWDRATVACLALTGGLGNTSFVGLPMIEAFFGKQYLGVGMLCDTAGSFMVLALPGIILAARASGQGVRGRELARRVLLFPPLVAIVLGFALQPVPYPEWFSGLLGRLGATLSPLALLSVGLTLRFEAIRGRGKELVVGLGYKLVLAPILIFILYVLVLGKTDMVTIITVFEAATGPMISGGIVAMTYGVRPRLVAGMLAVGIPLAFLNLSLWQWMLKAV
ncbi:AEC family transporter [Desulfovibrio sp. Fe33]|uniref:AEC family transporter n=1 Tax=Desulfovibrio sp. Fe33 TaxID=3020842 RepID=UPI00234D1EB7|nr:AEC family transporter [Desulfovibrio sp. Fe33]